VVTGQQDLAPATYAAARVDIRPIADSARVTPV